MRTPLPYKKIITPDWVNNAKSKQYWDKRLRVLSFDPTEIYERLGNRINPNKRKQFIEINAFFPDKDGLCACGCGKPARKRWASDACSDFAWTIRNIICHGTQEARKYIETYYGKQCLECGADRCDIDHVIPVKHGGGGCWLSNYVPLCQKCHKTKTRKDFKWGEFKENNQLKLI